MKKQVKVIIGANYGDEGKGLATVYFAEQAQRQDQKCLNVLFNGGCQRGHTVETEDGFRHVYSHFGCGSHFGADTYFDRNFMVNPVMFIQECHKLTGKGEKIPKCFISPKCRVITIYDMLINQIRENHRGNDRHGSCGHGIWETRRRYDNGKFAKTFGELVNMKEFELHNYLYRIANEYSMNRLKYCGISLEDIPDRYMSHFCSEGLINHYIRDFKEMINHVKIAEFDDIVDQYDFIIFEGAQGLGLDEDNYIEIPHTTASHTNSDIPRERVENLDCEIEIVYVTRTYFTRHGAGRLITECPKEEINPDIVDLTNEPNDYQGTIRYGKFDKDDFWDRVCNDGYITPALSHKVKDYAIFITHLNETNNEICGNITIRELWLSSDKVYVADGKYTSNVKVLEDD